MTLEERILSKIEKMPNGCWEWQGGRNNRGYGNITVHGRSRGAHVVAHELWIGPIPKGLSVFHKCKNSACCNPAHLYAGSRKQNVQD
jgi:hypothetical protein